MNELSVQLQISKLAVEHLDSFSAMLDEYRVFYGKPSNIDESRCYVADNIGNDNVIFLLARDNNNQTIGFCTLLRSLSTVRAKKIMLLNDLYVKAQYRRNSYATKLLEHAIYVVKEQGCDFVKLDTAEDNLVAQECYRQNGWNKLGFISYGFELGES